MTIELIPAEKFTLQELTDLYNQTRVDYLVPMPMNANRLGEYVHDFDIDLARSCVARALTTGSLACACWECARIRPGSHVWASCLPRGEEVLGWH